MGKPGKSRPKFRHIPEVRRSARAARFGRIPLHLLLFLMCCECANALRHGFCDTDVLIGCAVVEAPLVAVTDQALSEYNVRNLPHLFPVLLGPEDGLL